MSIFDKKITGNMSEEDLNKLASKVATLIDQSNKKASKAVSSPRAFDMKKPADLLSWTQSESQAIAHVQGSTGSKSYNFKNIIMQDEKWSIGDVIHSVKRKDSENARFIWLDKPGGNILSKGAYPLLFAALEGSPLLDETHPEPSEFKIKDLIGRPYLKGADSLKLVDESLPALGLSSTIQNTATDHNHPLSSVGKATGITNLGGAELKFDENGDGAESLNQSAAAFTNFNGHVVARNNGSVRTVTMGSSSGTSYSRGFQVNIPDLNLKGTTDTKTQTHAHGITNSYGTLYSGGTNVNVFSIGLYRFLIGDRQA